MRSAVTTSRRRFSQEFKDELCQEVISTSKTIHAYVVALGGELEINAKFGDQRIAIAIA